MNVLQLLRAWEQWEADIIADNKAWPDNQMTINGTHYEKMLELQIKRNEAIKHVAVPIVPVVKQDDCSGHKKDLFGHTNMKEVAEAIENMSYEKHPELFKWLGKLYQQRSRNDWKEGKIQTSTRGKNISEAMKSAYINASEMWQISKPFMTPPNPIKADETLKNE